MSNQEIDDFKTRVLYVLAHLPAGCVISYGELAKQTGHPRHARQVGQILKKLPHPTSIPWHRVVNSQHRISFNEGSDAYLRQKALLENEGWLIVGQKLIKKETP